MFFVANLKKVLLLMFTVSPLFSQGDLKNEFIDSEVQNYFETRYGYKNPVTSRDLPFRDSPVSQINENAVFKISSIHAGYKPYKKNLSNPLYLYYSVKKAYDPGPISSCVIEPGENNNAFLEKYLAVEILVSGKDSREVYEKVIQPSGFVIGGEEYSKESGTDYKTIIGWIPESQIPFLIGNKAIKGVYFSKARGLKAPPVRVNLILKAPYDMDLSVFTQAFTRHLSSIGFNAGEVKNIIGGQNARFHLIEINGSIPIDRTAQVLADPFVLKLTAQKGI